MVIGYSFPETDLQSSNLFCNAFLRRQTMPKVHIVDPTPERVTGKFQNWYGIRSDHLTVHATHFSEDFDLGTVFAAVGGRERNNGLAHIYKGGVCTVTVARPIKCPSQFVKGGYH